MLTTVSYKCVSNILTGSNSVYITIQQLAFRRCFCPLCRFFMFIMFIRSFESMHSFGVGLSEFSCQNSYDLFIFLFLYKRTILHCWTFWKLCHFLFFLLFLRFLISAYSFFLLYTFSFLFFLCLAPPLILIHFVHKKFSVIKGDSPDDTMCPLSSPKSLSTINLWLYCEKYFDCMLLFFLFIVTLCNVECVTCSLIWNKRLIDWL